MLKITATDCGEINLRIDIAERYSKESSVPSEKGEANKSVQVLLKNEISFLRKKVFMVIMIPSKPDSEDYRQNLRTKWLNRTCWKDEEFKEIDERYLNFELMFVVGKLKRNRNFTHEFFEEVSEHNDIYLVDKEESKFTLKHKVLFGMRESLKFFDYEYFIKIDHDTLVDLPNLARGIQSLPKDSILTGSCYNRLKRGDYRNHQYCSGGAYILSRDVIEKIASLRNEEVDIKMGYHEPEDAFTGWLVSYVNKKFNNTDIKIQHNKVIVNRVPLYPYTYVFSRWFNHWIKGLENMEKAFQCRMTANLSMAHCPTSKFRYQDLESSECSCVVDE
ncbi:hypothetical protein ACHWQZ_G001431 [Mnemiopsis leidyi]